MTLVCRGYDVYIHHGIMAAVDVTIRVLREEGSTPFRVLDTCSQTAILLAHACDARCKMMRGAR
jgi:hypothetical protein